LVKNFGFNFIPFFYGVKGRFYKTLIVQISGHTDNVGSDSSNQKLSTERANKVREYLLSKGIDEKRITSKGYGASKPIAPNTTDEGKKKNRRVDLLVLEI